MIDFQILLAKAMSFFEENHPRFHQYMKTMYASRAEQWASCYRLNTQLDTNMHVETFHRVIKIDYLKHKQNRRIDHLLHILFKYNRDLVFNFLKKEIFGKRSHKVCEIMMHHRAALKTCEKGNADIVAIDDYTWRLQSESEPGKWYTVEKSNNDTSCGCHLKCDECNICVHTYSCTCLNAILHNTICKHVHLSCLLSCRGMLETSTSHIWEIG